MSGGPAERETTIPIGSIIGGKYRVESVLGHGGMGIVLAATNEMLGTHVAVKLLRDRSSDSPEQMARLLREAQVVARLRSEHVARVLDVGKLDDGSPYVVLEHLTGSDLAQLLEQRGPLHVSDAVDYVLQALDAIAEAHRNGLVHRDLKPSNLFLTTKNDGTPLVKVLDFGIAKANPVLASTEVHITEKQTTMGSPAYMSPEQIKEARSVDARADVWSLGVILYELITGVSPFRAETAGAVFAAIFSGEPRPLTELRSDAPAGIDDVIKGCLQRDRDHRIPDVATLARQLSPFASSRGKLVANAVVDVLATVGDRQASLPHLQGVPPQRRSGSVDEAVTVTSPPHTPVATPPPPDQPRPTRRPWLLAAAAILTALGAVAAMLASPSGDRPGSDAGARSAALPSSSAPATAPSAPASSSSPAPERPAPAPPASVSSQPSATHAPEPPRANAPDRPRPPTLLPQPPPPPRKGGLDLDRRD